MLIGLIYLYIQSGTWSILEWHQFPLTLEVQKWLFLGFLAAFSVKIPMWPVHTWLPDAHVEAPTGGSVVLAAIMLKIGGYGFIRFSLPITPDASAALDWLIITLSSDRSGLYRLCRAGSERHEKADRLFIHFAYGFRHTRPVPGLCHLSEHGRWERGLRWVLKGPWCK